MQVCGLFFMSFFSFFVYAAFLKESLKVFSFLTCTFLGQERYPKNFQLTVPQCLRHTLRLLAAAFRSSAKSSQCAVKPSVSYVLLL